MIEFTTWDILRNLLLATRWTILLSLVSFVGGGAVGLILLFLRIGKRNGAARVAVEILHRALPGHAAADAALPGLLRPRRSSASTCRPGWPPALR